eukprot:jgi/Psemu1/27326/gm1.27326_g
MEANTFYSAMAAKPPQKNPLTTINNNTQPRGKGPGGNSNTNTKRLEKFTGHNQTDLKGILIPKDATAKHYNELKDRLKTLGGSNYIPQVGSSIQALTRFNRNDFALTKPTPEEYSEDLKDDVATRKIKTIEVTNLKDTLMDMYKHGRDQEESRQMDPILT